MLSRSSVNMQIDQKLQMGGGASLKTGLTQWEKQCFVQYYVGRRYYVDFTTVNSKCHYFSKGFVRVCYLAPVLIWEITYSKWGVGPKPASLKNLKSTQFHIEKLSEVMAFANQRSAVGQEQLVMVTHYAIGPSICRNILSIKEGSKQSNSCFVCA